MADTTHSIPVPAPRGPVTAAIRATALEHDPSRIGDASILNFRPKRPPVFTPQVFTFPLTDSLWASCYLRPVRFAVDFVALTGRAAVDRIGAIRGVEPGAVTSTVGQLSLAIDHFEELTELLRTARGRLLQADTHAAQIDGGRADR